MIGIKWDEIISQLDPVHGEIRTMGENFYQNKDGRFNEIIALWDKAGYTSSKVEWINFYPNTHFSNDIVTEFAKHHNVTTIRAWISCIRPGKSAPWHQDIDDNSEEYNKLGKVVRYTCFIGKPSVGQVTLVSTNSYYMVPESTVIKWDDPMAWHGASNCGFDHYYLFHLLAYENI